MEHYELLREEFDKKLTELRDDLQVWHRTHEELDSLRFGAVSNSLGEVTKALNEFKKTIEPVVDAYKGFIFSKSFLTGIGAVVASCVVIGGFILWLIRIK